MTVNILIIDWLLFYCMQNYYANNSKLNFNQDSLTLRCSSVEFSIRLCKENISKEKKLIETYTDSKAWMNILPKKSLFFIIFAIMRYFQVLCIS